VNPNTRPTLSDPQHYTIPGRWTRPVGEFVCQIMLLPVLCAVELHNLGSRSKFQKKFQNLKLNAQNCFLFFNKNYSVGNVSKEALKGIISRKCAVFIVFFTPFLISPFLKIYWFSCRIFDYRRIGGDLFIKFQSS
jgi:hypothetical protein